MLLERGEAVGGVESVAQHDGAAEQHRQVEVRPAPGVEDRRGDVHDVAGLEVELGEQRDGGIHAGLGTGCALGGAGCAGREDHRPGEVLGRLGHTDVTGGDQVLRRLALDLTVGPAEVTRTLDAGGVDEPLELLVIDDRDGLLPLADLAQLGRGEGRVEVEDVRTELGQRRGHLEEVAVVAAQHRDSVAFEDPAIGERVGEPRRALVDLAPGQRPALVDQRNPVRVEGRLRADAAGEAHPPVDQAFRGRRQMIGTVRADDARLGHGLDHDRLAAGLAGSSAGEVVQHCVTVPLLCGSRGFTGSWGRRAGWRSSPCPPARSSSWRVPRWVPPR